MKTFNLAESKRTEKGFVLIVTMVMLVVLTLIGVTAIRSSKVELQLSGNGKWLTDSFYRSESGVELTTRLLEDLSTGKVGATGASINVSYGNVLLPDIDFDLGTPLLTQPVWTDPATDTLINTNIFFPRQNVRGSSPYTIGQRPLTQIQVRKMNRKPIGGSTETGRSGSSPASPPEALFDIWSRNIGRADAEDIVRLEWLHIDK